MCEQYPPACIPSTACCLLSPAAAETYFLLPKLFILPAHHLSPSWLLLTKAPFFLSQPLPKRYIQYSLSLAVVPATMLM